LSEFGLNEILTIILGSGVVTTFITWYYEGRVRKTKIELEDKRKAAEIALEDKRTAAANLLEDKRAAIKVDVERRKEAQKDFLPLYGKIVVLSEYAMSYNRCPRNRSELLFIFEEGNYRYDKLPEKEILKLYKKSYDEFCRYYIEKKAGGLEMFLTNELEDCLISFWRTAKLFCIDETKMKDNKKIEQFDQLTEKTTEVFEKVFGLIN
jgi:hypothetical protein